MEGKARYRLQKLEELYRNYREIKARKYQLYNVDDFVSRNMRHCLHIHAVSCHDAEEKAKEILSEFLNNELIQNTMTSAIMKCRDQTKKAITNMVQFSTLNKLRFCILQFIFSKEVDAYTEELDRLTAKPDRKKTKHKSKSRSVSPKKSRFK